MSLSGHLISRFSFSNIIDIVLSYLRSISASNLQVQNTYIEIELYQDGGEIGEWKVG
jgi:hypothetical protein